MIIPSFESVAGLGSATPYISKALKSVSRQFRSLENAISDQVKRIREILGEELSANTSGGTSSSTSGKHDSSNIARLKFLDESFQKNKFIAASSTSGYVEHQQNSWRPQQKGLPERAVSVLRAWLFDHFLHPYVLYSIMSLYICVEDWLQIRKVIEYTVLSFFLQFVLGTPQMQISTC